MTKNWILIYKIKIVLLTILVIIRFWMNNMNINFEVINSDNDFDENEYKDYNLNIIYEEFVKIQKI